MEGISIPIIQRQLGHTSLATTDTYLSHIAPKQVIEAIANREWTVEIASHRHARSGLSRASCWASKLFGAGLLLWIPRVAFGFRESE
jgi:hypothetical protein